MKLKQEEFLIVVEARKATFWPTSGLKERHINNSGVSAAGTFFSTSMVPNWGDCLGKTKPFEKLQQRYKFNKFNYSRWERLTIVLCVTSTRQGRYLDVYIQLIVSSFPILPVSVSVFVTDPTAGTYMGMFFPF